MVGCSSKPRAQKLKRFLLVGILHFPGQTGQAAVENRAGPGPVKFSIGRQSRAITHRLRRDGEMLQMSPALESFLFRLCFTKEVFRCPEKVAAESTALTTGSVEGIAREDGFEKGVGEITRLFGGTPVFNKIEHRKVVNFT